MEAETIPGHVEACVRGCADEAEDIPCGFVEAHVQPAFSLISVCRGRRRPEQSRAAANRMHPGRCHGRPCGWLARAWEGTGSLHTISEARGLHVHQTAIIEPHALRSTPDCEYSRRPAPAPFVHSPQEAAPAPELGPKPSLGSCVTPKCRCQSTVFLETGLMDHRFPHAENSFFTRGAGCAAS